MTMTDLMNGARAPISIQDMAKLLAASFRTAPTVADATVAGAGEVVVRLRSGEVIEIEPERLDREAFVEPAVREKAIAGLVARFAA